MKGEVSTFRCFSLPKDHANILLAPGDFESNLYTLHNSTFDEHNHKLHGFPQGSLEDLK